MSNRLRVALESIREQDQPESVDIPEEDNTELESVIEDVLFDEVDTQAGAAEMVETATASLEHIFDLLHETLEHGGADRHTRAMAIQAANCANLVTGARFRRVSLESAKSDVPHQAENYEKTQVALESLWDNIKSGIRKIIQFLKNMWTRFRDWVKGMFTRNKRLAKEVAEQEEQIQTMQREKAQAPDPNKMVEIAPLMATYLDFNGVSSKTVDGWTDQFTTTFLRQILGTLPTVRQNMETAHGAVKAAIDKGDLQNIPVPEEQFKKPLPNFKVVGKGSFEGATVEISESSVMPGGYVFRMERLVNPPQETVEQRMHFAARTKFSTLPRVDNLKVKTEFKLLPLNELQRMSKAISSAMDLNLKVVSGMESYTRDGEQILKSVELTTSRLERLNVVEYRKRQRLVNESVSMLRRYMSSLIAYDRVHTSYASQMILAYKNYISLQLKEYAPYSSSALTESVKQSWSLPEGSR